MGNAEDGTAFVEWDGERLERIGLVEVGDEGIEELQGYDALATDAPQKNEGTQENANEEKKPRDNSIGVGKAATPRKKGKGGKGASSSSSASSAGTKRAAEADLEEEQKSVAEEDKNGDAMEDAATDK